MANTIGKQIAAMAVAFPPAEDIPAWLEEALGLVVVADPQGDVPATLISLTFGCPLTTIDQHGPDANIPGIPTVVADTPFEQKVLQHVGEAYDGNWPGWANVVAYLRSQPRTRRRKARGDDRPVVDPAGATQFIQDFVILFRTTDMRPEDECHTLYDRAAALLGPADRPAK